MANQPVIGIVMGSKSDLPVMKKAADILRQFDVPFELRVLSAHRAPHETAEWASTAYDRGLRVLIAAAGWAAHLAGVVAAHTPLPVIGVPMTSPDFQGLDSLLSTVQMPSGVPVASMAVGGSKNAALFALQILGTSDPALLEKIKAFKQSEVVRVAKMNADAQTEVFGDA